MSQASTLQKAITGVLVSVSLWALLSAALPGLGGLAFVSAAGMRLGYRQARAGFMVRTSGTARFVGPGMLGVVRTGSFIELRTRSWQRRAETHEPRNETLATVTELKRVA